MNTPTVSVIVVSRGRPGALKRCLKGIEQLDYPAFEVVVVSDPAGLAAIGPGPDIKTVAFDAANISEARNRGIARAAGDIVAFIDDDSVPEPTWLRYLTAPFRDAGVVAAGGYVRARNGISFQSIAQQVDATGVHTPLPIGGDRADVFDGSPGLAIKTEGTNCAFRRDILLKIGGFDPAFAFYMDETDLNLRLAAGGARTAIVPLAQVHHGFAASDRRHRSRMPRTLFDIGASQVVLLRKHAPGADHDQVLHAVRAEQRARLLRHMVAGNCESRDVETLMQTLELGFDVGRARSVAPLPPLAGTTARFAAFRGGRRFDGADHLAGRIWQKAQLRDRARARIADGRRCSIFLFSPTALFHQVRFHPDGYWEQQGGIFGKSDRADRIFTLAGFRSRLKREINRVQTVRNFTK